MNPFVGLARSRKFWLLVLDTFLSLTIYFVAKYAGASVTEDVGLVILVMQPVFVAIILAVAWEDAAEKGASLTYMREDCQDEDGAD